MNVKSVPFYSNTSDDTHCYQAALRMVLKYFLPHKEYSWEELEQLTAKVKNLWTWPTQGLISLYKFGFHVVEIEDFDIDAFIKDGEAYLIQKFGEEVGKEQIQHSDIEQERNIYKKYLKLHVHEQRVPNIEDIKKLLEDDYLVVCNVNSCGLSNTSGYVGHFVVIYDYNQNNLILHDPGLPALQARSVSYGNFLRAWEYPNQTAKNIMAFKME